jgi:hypothetical protein
MSLRIPKPLIGIKQSPTLHYLGEKKITPSTDNRN